MNPDLGKLADDLDPLIARYEQWQEPLRKFQTENLFRVNRNGYTLEMFQRGIADLQTSLEAQPNPRTELFIALERLCCAYLDCDVAGQAEIRDLVARRNNLGLHLWGYANHLTKRLADSHATQILRVALTAIAIENCSFDVRDTMVTLADLYVGIEEAGIDPKPLFQDASLRAADAPTPGGCESLAKMLRDFSSYAVVRERRSMGRPYHEKG